MMRAVLAIVLILPWTPGAVAGPTLRLVGTVALSPGAPGDSHAVFETGDGRQLKVRAGQKIGGCDLASILPRKVVVECADGFVTLLLRSGLRTAGEPVDVTPARYQVTLPREAFGIAVSDRQRVASQVSLEPEVREGWLYGYRVAWLQDGGEFHRLGLQADDVVLSLNGVPASTPGAFMQAVDGLRGLSGFQLTVERSGGLIEYSYLFD